MDRYSYYRSEPSPAAGQLSGVLHKGRFYEFTLETFHLNEIARPAKKDAEHCHAVYHLLLFQRGNAIRLGGATLEVPPGAAVWTAPGEPHSFASTRHPCAEYHEITFSLRHRNDTLGVGMAELIKYYLGADIELPERPFILLEPDFKRLNDAYEEIAGALRRRSGAEVRADAARLLALAFGGPASKTATVAAPQARLMRAAELLRHKPASALTLESVAMQIGMSREYFCRSFTAYFKTPPMRFRRNHRLQLAAQMLRFSDRPLKAIAESAGFSDIQHLTHAFKAYYGISPNRFRRNAFTAK